MNIFYLTIAVLGLIVFVPGVLFFVFFVFGEKYYFKTVKSCQKQHLGKPHDWSLWEAVLKGTEDSCSERYCFKCGIVEKNKFHDYVLVHDTNYDCEPELFSCLVCDYVKKVERETPHTFETDNGFGTRYCTRCKREFPLI